MRLRREFDSGVADAARMLRERGLRATGPRTLILSTLWDERDHPTPERIHTLLKDAHPSLSLSTVYQTLEKFLQAGLCKRVATRSGRLQVDGVLHEHDHAVCRTCGSIFDLERGESLRLPEPQDLPPGTELKGVRLEYDIVCQECRSETSGN